MMNKKLLCALLALVMLLVLPVSVCAAEPEEFTGTRSVEFTVDWSDLENYINGGRSAFDLILRTALPEWATYQLRTQGRDVYFTFQFSFVSLDEYKSRVAALVLRKPAVVCTQEEDLMLIENCTSIQLLNFLESALLEQGSLSEKSLDEMMTLSKSSITVNSETYELADGVNIHPGGDETVLLDHLSIETESNQDGSFTRTITAQIDKELASSGDMDTLEVQFTRAGDPNISKESDTLRQITVTFDAGSQSELALKTMMCLNVSTFIEELQTPAGKSGVLVERTEFIALDQLLREGGTFSWDFEYPSWCENPTAADGSPVIADGHAASDTSFITYTYERELQFSSVEICTDLSKILGKTRRTITCTLPADLAVTFHDRIVDKLKLNLVNGAVLDIYDEGGIRYYQISFSSWRMADIEAFTAAVLDTPNYTFDLQSSWLPFGLCEISDNYNADGIISRIVPADEMTAVYQLPALTFPEEGGTAEISGNTASFSIRSGTPISLSFRQVHVVKCALLLLGAVLLLILILKIVGKIRRLIARLQGKEIPEKPKKKRRKKQAAPQPPATVFCPYCGTRNNAESRYCKNCGGELELPPDNL